MMVSFVYNYFFKGNEAIISLLKFTSAPSLTSPSRHPFPGKK